MTTSIIDHPKWPSIRPWIKVEEYNRDGSAIDPRFRLEVFERAPAWLLAIEVGCCECGKPIHPFRRRTQAKRGHAADIYFACACPLDVRVGCSRGNTARDEYLRVRAAVEGRTMPTTPSLFP